MPLRRVPIGTASEYTPPSTSSEIMRRLVPEIQRRKDILEALPGQDYANSESFREGARSVDPTNPEYLGRETMPTQGGSPFQEAASRSGGTDYLAQRRSRFAEELNSSPDLKKALAAISTLEASDPRGRTAVVESLMNRMDFTNQSLQKGMFGGFYGPVERGQLPGAISRLEKDPKAMEAAMANIDTALSGSNFTKGHTDQGMRGDRNYTAGGPGVEIGGNRFNDFGGGPGGNEGARNFRQMLMQGYVQAGGGPDMPPTQTTQKSSVDAVFKSPSGQDIRNGIDPNAPYMSRPRDLGDIKRIILHGDVQGNADSLLKYGRSVDPGRGFDAGYHFYVAKDGTITQGAPLDRRTNHALGENRDTIGIVVAGADNGKMPTDAQSAATKQLISDLGTGLNIDPKNVMGHGELQPNRRHALEGGRIAADIRSGGYLPTTAVASAPKIEGDAGQLAGAPQRQVQQGVASGEAPPTAAPDQTRRGTVVANLNNQEGQPVAPQTTAPVTSNVPGTVVASPGSPSPTEEAQSPGVIIAPDSHPISSAQDLSTRPQAPAQTADASPQPSALDSWQPGQPVGPALLKDVFGIDVSSMGGGGGGGGLLGLGGGKMPAFKNQVQVPNLPDLGAQLAQIAGQEPTSLPTSLPAPPPPVPPSPEGAYSYMQDKRRRRHA